MQGVGAPWWEQLHMPAQAHSGPILWPPPASSSAAGESAAPSQPPPGHPPAQVLLQHLVNADPERLVIEAFPDVVLVDPEFGCSHSFPFWDLGKIKPELPMVVARVEELSVMFHWKGKKTHPSTKSSLVTGCHCPRPQPKFPD